eukprot:scaffold140880_cov329-Phaeocystis_antarctica.AAC.1
MLRPPCVAHVPHVWLRPTARPLPNQDDGAGVGGGAADGSDDGSDDADGSDAVRAMVHTWPLHIGARRG